MLLEYLNFSDSFCCVIRVSDMMVLLNIISMNLIWGFWQCPDPHFKKRHHKRRILQEPLVDAIISNLACGGEVSCSFCRQFININLIASQALACIRNTKFLWSINSKAKILWSYLICEHWYRRLPEIKPKMDILILGTVFIQRWTYFIENMVYI